MIHHAANIGLTNWLLVAQVAEPGPPESTTPALGASPLVLILFPLLLLALLWAAMFASLRNRQRAATTGGWPGAGSMRPWLLLAIASGGCALFIQFLRTETMLTLLVAPWLLIFLVALLAGLYFLLQTPTGRWWLAAGLLTIVPLLLAATVTRNVATTVATVGTSNGMESDSVRAIDSFDAGLPMSTRHHVEDASAIPNASSSPPVATPPAAVTERSYEPRTKRFTTTESRELPMWMQDGTYPRRGTEKGLSTSERFATLEEARAQLLGNLRPRITSALASRYPQMKSWEPSLEQIESSGIIKHEATLTYALNVGEFSEPVHEVVWAYDLSDFAALQRLQQHWRHQETKDRIPLVASILIGIAAVFAAASGLLYRAGRVADPSHHQHSTPA